MTIMRVCCLLNRSGTKQVHSTYTHPNISPKYFPQRADQGQTNRAVSVHLCMAAACLGTEVLQDNSIFFKSLYRQAKYNSSANKSDPTCVANHLWVFLKSYCRYVLTSVATRLSAVGWLRQTSTNPHTARPEPALNGTSGPSHGIAKDLLTCTLSLLYACVPGARCHTCMLFVPCCILISRECM